MQMLSNLTGCTKSFRIFYSIGLAIRNSS